MDFESLCVGFLVGAFTAAAGNYLADKYTDRRRDKEELKKAQKSWDQVKKRYPKLLMEMVSDLSNEPEIRCFVVMPRITMVGFITERAFAYYPEEHPLVMSAVGEFIEAGMIKDITVGNLPRYRMSESFVDLILKR
jgi:hypothetical protein